MDIFALRFKYVMYIFFGFAILFAIAFGILEDSGQEMLFASLFATALGFSLLARVGDSIQTGTIRGRRKSVVREKNPVNFWGIVAVNALLGLILIGAGLWLALFR